MKNIRNQQFSACSLESINKIDRFQDGFTVNWERRRISIKGLKESAVVASTAAVMRMRGAELTDCQVTKFIKEGCEVTSVSTDFEREMAGYIKALNYIHENFKRLEVSEETIKDIHRLLMGELTEEQCPEKSKGVYKKKINSIAKRDPVTGEVFKVLLKTTAPGPATEMAMSYLIREYRELQSQCHPFILVVGFIIHFLTIHPFRDGNGRLSYLLTTWLLLHHGYKWMQYISHEKVIESYRENYYLCLQEAGSSLSIYGNNCGYQKWLDFFLKTLTEEVHYLREEFLKNMSSVMLSLNERRICRFIDGAKECRMSHIFENMSLSRSRLELLVGRLVEKGFVKKKGRGKAVVYFIS